MLQLLALNYLGIVTAKGPPVRADLLEVMLSSHWIGLLRRLLRLVRLVGLLRLILLLILWLLSLLVLLLIGIFDCSGCSR